MDEPDLSPEEIARLDRERAPRDPVDRRSPAAGESGRTGAEEDRRLGSDEENMVKKDRDLT